MSKKIISKLAICILSGLALFFILALIASLIFLKLPVDQSSYKAVAFSLSVVSVIITAFVATRLTQLKGIVAGTVTGAIFDLLLMTILLIMNSGQLSLTYLILSVVNIVVGAVSGIYSANR